MTKKNKKPIPANDNTFECIFENIIDGVNLVDAETKRFSLSNPAMSRLTGYTKDELLNLSIYDIHPEEILTVIEKIFYQFLERKTEIVEKMPVLTKKGTLIYTDIAASPIQYNGRLHLVATFRNITDRIKTEEELQRKEEFLRTILDTVADGILLVDKTNRISHVNRQFIEMWKVPDNIAGSEDDNILLNFIHDQLEDPGGFRERVNSLYDSDQKALDEIRFRDGRIFERYTSPLISGGVKFGRVWDFRDITWRKNAEAELRKNETLMTTLFETAPVGIALLVNRIHMKINSTLCRITGYSPEELIGKSTEMMYFTAEDSERTAASLYPQVQKNGIGIEEVYQRKKDGSGFYSLICLRPLDPENLPAGVVATVMDITDRRNAEEKLRMSEAVLRGIFEASPAGISLLKPDRTIVKLNRSLCRITGYAEDELLGRTTRHLYWSEEDYGRIGQTYSEMQRDGIGMAESLLKRKDGSVLNVLICLSSVNPDDIQDGVIATVLDITSLKMAENALRKSEEKYRTIVDNMQDAVYRTDLDGNIIFNSPSAARLLGYPSAETMIGINIGRDFYYHPEEMDKLLNQLNEEGSVSHFEVTLKRMDGSPLIVSVNSQYYRDSDGNILGVEGVFSDITERLKAEKSLKENEAMLKSLLDATPIGVGLLINRIYVKVNDSLCKMTGYSEEELVGQSSCMLYENKSEYDKAGIELYSQMESTELGMTESRMKRKDGTIINVILCLSPFNPEDITAGHTLTVFDITERKRIEAEKSRLEEMLLHSQKIESMGRLAGGIAHDFNNLLTAILGNTEMAMNQLDSSSRPYARLEVIKKAAEGAANLTRQLLAFSRKQVIEPKTINLNDLIEHVSRMITTLIGENIKLRTVLSATLSLIKADPGQAEQVIINLAANARDAMPDGGELTIETSDVYLDENYSGTHSGVLSGNYVVMTVTDNGMGMTRDTLEHAFEPFFTTKESGRGTGLGLATVYGIVKQNGGTIEIYSEISRGTVFKVYFPVSTQALTESVQDRDRGNIPAGSETILIVEDREDVLEFSRDILSQAGYRVLTAESGEQALTVSESYGDKIHMLITDIILPGMNGREIAERISVLRPGIRVLYNSGYTAEVIDRQGVLEKGIQFINKPFSSQELTAKIREILDK